MDAEDDQAQRQQGHRENILGQESYGDHEAHQRLAKLKRGDRGDATVLKRPKPHCKADQRAEDGQETERAPDGERELTKSGSQGRKCGKSDQPSEKKRPAGRREGPIRAESRAPAT